MNENIEQPERERKQVTLPCCGFMIWEIASLNIRSFGWSIFHDSGNCFNCLKKIKQPKAMLGKDESQVYAVPELAGL